VILKDKEVQVEAEMAAHQATQRMPQQIPGAVVVLLVVDINQFMQQEMVVQE
jgi:hypothetical protein